QLTAPDLSSFALPETQPARARAGAPKSAAPRRPVMETFAPADASWSLDQAPQVKDWFQQQYGRDLPVSALGESATHKRMGLDHSQSMDVALHPDSAEGQAFTSYL